MRIRSRSSTVSGRKSITLEWLLLGQGCLRSVSLHNHFTLAKVGRVRELVPDILVAEVAVLTRPSKADCGIRAAETLYGRDWRYELAPVRVLLSSDC